MSTTTKRARRVRRLARPVASGLLPAGATAALLCAAVMPVSAASPQTPASRRHTTQARLPDTKPTPLRPPSSLKARAALFEPLIAQASITYQVDPLILWVVAYNETRFRPYLTSPKGARGLMQFMDGTARTFGLANPYDPAQAVDTAARYVFQLAQQFEGRLDLVLAAYNAGEGAVTAYRDGRRMVLPGGKVINPRGRKTNGVPPYRETRRYVGRGLRLYHILERAGVLALARSRTPRVKVPDNSPEETWAGAEVEADKELARLGGAQSPIRNALRAAVPVKQPAQPVSGQARAAPLAQVSANSVVTETPPPATPPATPEEVFYDIHSGARYLVRERQVGQPLAPSGSDHTGRSRYFGGPRD